MPEALYSMEVWKNGSVEMNADDFTFIFSQSFYGFSKFRSALDIINTYYLINSRIKNLLKALRFTP